MKFYVALTLYCTVVLLCSCGRNKNANFKENIAQKPITQEQTSFDNKEFSLKENVDTLISVDIDDLQGVWSDDISENGVFYIENNHLTYIEDQSTNIPIFINQNTLFINAEVPFHLKILKITSDSLWYIDNIT